MQSHEGAAEVCQTREPGRLVANGPLLLLLLTGAACCCVCAVITLPGLNIQQRDEFIILAAWRASKHDTFE
jgi:hypothetical protein